MKQSNRPNSQGLKPLPFSPFCKVTRSAKGRPEAKSKEPKQSSCEKTTTCWEWCRACRQDHESWEPHHRMVSNLHRANHSYFSFISWCCPLERTPCLRCAKKHQGVSLTAGGIAVAVKMSRAKWKVRAPCDLLRLHPSRLNIKQGPGGTVQSTGGAESQETTPFGA